MASLSAQAICQGEVELRSACWQKTSKKPSFL